MPLPLICSISLMLSSFVLVFIVFISFIVVFFLPAFIALTYMYTQQDKGMEVNVCKKKRR